MSTPLVSVVIPVYEGARFISQTIASVLGQSWSNLEVIVVDDGSTDDSVARIRAFKDARLSLIETPNGGPCKARNLGWLRSRGDFIQFLDHDDLLHPRKIEIQMRRLLAEGIDCVTCGPWEGFDSSASDAQRTPEKLWRDDEPYPWVLSARSGDGIMPTGAWLTPRAVLERAGGWNEDLPRNTDDDGELFSRVVLASRRVLFCPDAIFYYRNEGPGHLRLSRSQTSVRSLYRTQEIYEKRLLGIEDSARSRRAAAYGYAHFLEMIYPSHPQLCTAAKRSLDRLQTYDYPSPGSRTFARLIGWLGLPAALWVRQSLRMLLGRPMLGGVFTAQAMKRRTIALRRLLHNH